MYWNSWQADLKQTVLSRQLCVQIALYTDRPVAELLWMKNHVLLWRSAWNLGACCCHCCCTDTFFEHMLQKKAPCALYLWHQVLIGFPSPPFSSIHAQRHLFLTPLSSKAVSSPGLINCASIWVELQAYHTTITFPSKACPTLPLIG